MQIKKTKEKEAQHQTSIRLPIAVWNALVDMADSEGLNVADVMRRALRKEVK